MNSLRRVRALSFSLCVFGVALQGIAQQAAPAAQSAAQKPPAISVKVKEVNLLAIVRDKKGQPVNSLNKQDFVLEQDGRAQTITQFAHESDLALTLGILADTGPGQRKALADERKADTEFVNRLLRESKDKAFVLHFDKEVELLQDVTASHDKLAKGIDQISVGEAPRNSGGGRGHGGDDGQSTALFFRRRHALRRDLLSSDEVLKGVAGTQGDGAVFRWRGPRQQDIAAARN